MFTFQSRYLQMVTLANSEEPDEMLHKAEFQYGSHCSQNKKQTFLTEMHHNFERFMDI